MPLAARLALATLWLIGLLAAPAAATVTVTGPAADGEPVRVDGSAAADSVVVRVASGSVRVIDPTGAALTTGTMCIQRSVTEVRCTTTAAPLVVLGAGDDRATVGEAPRATVDGGDGNDTVSYATFRGDGLAADLGRGVVHTGAVLSTLEAAEGSAYDDRLTGGPQATVLRGGGGEDVLDGGDGRDVVDGGPGDDRILAVDGDADSVLCGSGADVAAIDTSDGDDGACEAKEGPGAPPPPPVVRPSAPTPAPQPAPRPAVTPAPLPATVESGPAADGANTRVGARVRVATAATVALVVRHGEREVGRAQAGMAGGDQTTLGVPLDGETRAAVARERHLELDVAVETTYAGGAAVVERRRVTLVEPPPFIRGPAGVTRHGGFGPERISGTRRGDLLAGASGDDRLLGRAGNDTLGGGTGDDRLDGSAGTDRLDGFDGDDLLVGGPGDDLVIESRFGDDTLHGGPGDDWIVGARGVDTITGGPGDDVIFGGSGPDAIDCGAGADTVFVNLESERRSVRDCETILEEDDVPSIRCGDGEGTDNGETMLGSERDDTCLGHGGADDVEGAGGDDRLFGGAGGDRIFGRRGHDVLVGEDGDDEIEGGRGRDTLSGGPGDDQLNGGYDPDRVDGGPGDDLIIARSGGRDLLDCGPGRDTAIVDRRDRVRGCERIRRR